MENRSCDLAINPFENHLVIDKILKHIHFEELKAVRLLNSFWNQLANPYLEQRAWIHLTDSNAQDFNRFQQTTTVKFRNFHLKSVSLQFGENESPAHTFFKRHGSEIEEIVLDSCTFTFQSDAAKLVGEYLPNCKTLSISSAAVNPGRMPMEDDEEPESLPEFIPNYTIKYLEIVPGTENRKIAWWEQLFKLLPGLTSLNVQCRNPTDMTHMLDALLNANPQLRDLSEFSSFLTELNDHHLRQLMHLNLPFTALDLNLCPSVTWEVLHDLLTSCAQSLRNLKLFHGSLPNACDEFPIKFSTGFPYDVQLDALHSLELIGDMIPSFGFLKHVPNLSKLCILQACNEDECSPSGVPESLHVEDTKDEGLVGHKNLTTLSMEYSMHSACIRKLATKIAPHLRSLSMYLNDESIRAVFHYMENLEELSVLGTEVTDEGLTGVEMEQLMAHDSDILRLKTRTRKTFPSIGDCKHLKNFSLYAQPQENISDYSVHLGFMAARNLGVLELPLTAITDEGIEALQRKSNLVSLSCKYFVEDGHVSKRVSHLQNWHWSMNYGSESSICNK